MAYENLFHTEIGHGLFLISTDLQGKSMFPGPATTNSYLVIGEEKAMLFDLAVDDPAVKEYVQTLTDKPMMLVLSHCHYDHVYHLNRFLDAWLHEQDASLLDGTRFGTSKIDPCPSLHFLCDGDTVDLGNRILDVIHIPGHTPGSILLLDRKTKILLSGDTGARRLLLGVTARVSIEDLCADLERLKNYDFEVMYSAHDRCAIPKGHIDTMLDTIRKDLAGAKRIVPVPDVGDLLCVSRGEETDLAYFDIALLERKDGYHEK